MPVNPTISLKYIVTHWYASGSTGRPFFNFVATLLKTTLRKTSFSKKLYCFTQDLTIHSLKPFVLITVFLILRDQKQSINQNFCFKDLGYQ